MLQCCWMLVVASCDSYLTLAFLGQDGIEILALPKIKPAQITELSHLVTDKKFKAGDTIFEKDEKAEESNEMDVDTKPEAEEPSSEVAKSNDTNDTAKKPV